MTDLELARSLGRCGGVCVTVESIEVEQKSAAVIPDSCERSLVRATDGFSVAAGDGQCHRKRDCTSFRGSRSGLHTWSVLQTTGSKIRLRLSILRCYQISVLEKLRCPSKSSRWPDLSLAPKVGEKVIFSNRKMPIRLMMPLLRLTVAFWVMRHPTHCVEPAFEKFRRKDWFWSYQRSWSKRVQKFE